jgi:4-carboxymuconolactone decarboxylase
MSADPSGTTLADLPAARGDDASPRVDPLATEALDWRSRVVVWVIARVTGEEAPRVFTTLARHPRLFRRWLPFAGSLLLGTDLPRVDVELVVLRTACNAGSPYIWTQHVDLARRAGLAPACVDAVPTWRDSGIWSPRQRALLGAADELHEQQVIGDATWRELVRWATEHERIELCFVVGHYEMVAMAVNTLGVESEPAAAARLDEAAARVARGAAQRLGQRRAAPGLPPPRPRA